MRRVIAVILLVAWMVLIFAFSNASGEDSGAMSGRLIRKIVLVFSNVEDNSEELESIVASLSFVVRKGAHCFEYFVLAILAGNTLSSFNIKRNVILYATLFCAFYAMTDEFHQLFIPNRSGQISDVFIDSTASFIGAYTYHELFALRGRYAKKRY